jgi:hypothetical protein
MPPTSRLSIRPTYSEAVIWGDIPTCSSCPASLTEAYGLAYNPRFIIPHSQSPHRGKHTMKRTWSPDELAARWTLTDAERQPLPGRVDHNPLGFAAHLTCVAHEALFPESPRDSPAAALNALSTPRHIPSTAVARDDGRGRTRKHHRAQIRAWFGFRPFTATDGDALQAWLHQDVLPLTSPLQPLEDTGHDWYRDHHLEPPTSPITTRASRP